MRTGKDKTGIVFFGRHSKAEQLSGPEKCAKRIFDIHSKSNSSVFIQYFFDGRKYGFVKKLFGKQQEQSGSGSEIYTLGLFRIIPLLIKLKPGIIHIITFERFAIISFLYKMFSKVKVVYNSHGIVAHENDKIKSVTGFYKFKDRICEKFFLKHSDKIIFPSERTIDIAEKYFRFNGNKAVILAGGIDEVFGESFNRKKSTSRLKAVIMDLSEFSFSGMRFLNDLLKTIEVNIDFYIIGNKFNFSESKLNIFFVNRMDTKALAEFYADKNIFLSLNDYDTFSIAAIEAMAAGLIPVVTSETGMSRYVLNYENGYIVNFGDAGNLKNILEQITNDTALQNKISVSASKIFEILSWKNIYDSYLNVYNMIRP